MVVKHVKICSQRILLRTHLISLITKNDNRQIVICAKVSTRNFRKYKKIEGDEKIAKELQNGNKSDSRAKNQD